MVHSGRLKVSIHKFLQKLRGLRATSNTKHSPNNLLFFVCRNEIPSTIVGLLLSGDISLHGLMKLNTESIRDMAYKL